VYPRTSFVAGTPSAEDEESHVHEDIPASAAALGEEDALVVTS
jgi:hypothetical protein